MTDLNELKQQLYAKIQANSKPEKPLTQEDLLKNDEIPQYQSHQRLRNALEQQRPKRGSSI